MKYSLSTYMHKITACWNHPQGQQSIALPLERLIDDYLRNRNELVRIIHLFGSVDLLNSSLIDEDHNAFTVLMYLPDQMTKSAEEEIIIAYNTIFNTTFTYEDIYG